MTTLRLSIITIAVGFLVWGCGSDDPMDPDPTPKPTKLATTLEPWQDNTLFEDTLGAWSAGASENIYAGKTAGPNGGNPTEPVEERRAVLMFDLSSIPATATIDSVCLRLTVTKSSPTTGDRFYNIHRLTNDWGEGDSFTFGEGGGGAAADPGDATWIHTYSDSVLWNTPGGDFVTASEDSSLAGDEGTSFKLTSSEMITTVRGWFSGSVTNHGWIIIGENQARSAKRFASRENSTSADRPKLQVFYTNTQ